MIIMILRKTLFSFFAIYLLQACVTTPTKDEMVTLQKQQPALIAQQKAQLLPERPQQTDLYFVGFGADYSQNVFKKEVRYAQNLFDQRFDTKGRSTLLINNNETDQQLPMANYRNLKKTLKYVGEKMNAEEDILFLFLTGHGIKGNGLVINYGPQQKAVLSPSQLKWALYRAKIKWKVIVVSSCYSGIYVGYLRDKHTLVMTASNASQPSFGCSSTADFTYFGKAYFKDQLATDTSFIEAFEQAKIAIAKRERGMKFDASKPQIHVEQTMRDKLTELKVN